MSGYIRNCYIKRRDGGPEPFKDLVPYLNGYALVPTEEYLDRDVKWPARAKDYAHQLGHPEPVNPDGYICNCFVVGRESDRFAFRPVDGRYEAHLDGYTVVPLEEFCR